MVSTSVRGVRISDVFTKSCYRYISVKCKGLFINLILNISLLYTVCLKKKTHLAVYYTLNFIRE